MNFEQKKWWKEEIVYQVYPRSFMDSNGDGIGDLKGIISKLDYIESLGITAVWLNPIYDSPNDDMGYDIRDYRKIMTEFGNMEDFDILLSGLHDRNIKLLMDLVVNHTSDEHMWFQEAVKSKDNPYHDYYIFKDAKDGLPNNWDSYFSGPAWKLNKTTGEYYLHLFTQKQPDLNWKNPKVRNEVYDLMKFWFDKGIDGFRMDVINVISKKEGLPDRDLTKEIGTCYKNGPKLHDYLREMNREVLTKYNCLTVGECSGARIEDALETVGYNRNELQTLFHFEAMLTDAAPDGNPFLKTEIDLLKLKEVFTRWHHDLYNKAWNSIYLMNHDQPRSVSRFGNDTEYRKESAKMLGTFQLSMCGTPYIYQGEEIGMTNCHFEPEEFRDVQAVNYRNAKLELGIKEENFMPDLLYKTRDNSRTPIQWNSGKNGGFSKADKTWIKLNPNYKDINISESEQDKDSILHYFRKMIKLRKNNPVLTYGDYELLDRDNKKIYAYKRFTENKSVLIILNFSKDNVTFTIPENINVAEPIIYNYPKKPNLNNNTVKIKPYEAVIYRLI
ncbi:MAG: alpha-glucosidase [bacterium]|nr:alpha-glucosidase [bacterium]